MMCCEWMTNGVKRMNDNGITVVPRREYGARYFAVRFRAMVPELWDAVSMQLPKGTPFAKGAEVGINCCPGCGANLAEWILHHTDVFDELVSQVVD